MPGAIWGNIVLRLGNRAIETDVSWRKPFGEHFGPAGRRSTTFRNGQQRSSGVPRPIRKYDVDYQLYGNP
ncbi:MAG: hypothetical protein DMG89_11190 [Acidobacteria bacterium]|nr:MAG: hypothetical protein DMG89_11190 [Acidobacteriota bacterium]